MTDRASRHPGRMKCTNVDTGEVVYFDMEMADDPTVTGTPLNKANLLTDSVAQLLGLTSEDPTVNEALNALATGAGGGSGGYFAQCDSSMNSSVKEISIPEMKKTPAVGDRITVLFTSGNTIRQPTLRLTYNSGNDVHTSDICISSMGYGASYAYMWSIGAAVELVYTSHYRGGSYFYQWQPVNTGFDYAAFWFRDAYRGTGAYGSENPVTLTASGYIVLGLIEEEGSTDFCLIVNGEAISFVGGEWSKRVYRSGGGGSTSSGIYSDTSAAEQMNEAGKYYHYAVIVARN